MAVVMRPIMCEGQGEVKQQSGASIDSIRPHAVYKCESGQPLTGPRFQGFNFLEIKPGCRRGMVFAEGNRVMFLSRFN
jgi:hypothetical protein